MSFLTACCWPTGRTGFRRPGPPSTGPEFRGQRQGGGQGQPSDAHSAPFRSGRRRSPRTTSMTGQGRACCAAQARCGSRATRKRLPRHHPGLSAGEVVPGSPARPTEPLTARRSRPLNATLDGAGSETTGHRRPDPPPPGDGSAHDQDEIQKITFNNPGVDVMETRTRAGRGAEIPGGRRTGNARWWPRSTPSSPTRVPRAKRFMSEPAAAGAGAARSRSRWCWACRPVFGMGFGLAGTTIPRRTRTRSSWGGYGGSLISSTWMPAPPSPRD